MRLVRWTGVASALVLVCALPAFAQDAAPGAGGQDRAERRAAREAGQPGARGRVSVAMVPVDILGAELRLTEGQRSQIRRLQDAYQARVRELTPRREPGAQPGQQPQRDPARAQEMRDLGRRANEDILAVLNEQQRQRLPEVIRHMGALRTAGIPLQALGVLRLTQDQRARIVQMVQTETEALRDLQPEERRARTREAMQGIRERVGAVLTAEQRTALARWNEEQRQQRRQRGGGGAGGGGAAGGGGV
ncbi:MAG TPA: Spy/CpxP family protein refolding chaperone [Chthonomonadales bacterium]|nr:Spy/CpxP family protein refolding chaperone [Chthonomonadales bacterium]